MTGKEFKMVAENAAKSVSLLVSRIWARPATRQIARILAVYFAIPVCGLIAAFGVATDTQLDTIPRQEVTQTLALPSLQDSIESGHVFLNSERVRSGDTVAALMQRLNVDDDEADKFIRTTPAAKTIFQLRPGRFVRAHVDRDGELKKLSYLHSADKMLNITRGPNGFVAEEKALIPTVERVTKSGVIKSSLFGATDTAGVPDAIADQLAKIFSTDIDFHIDLRRGDKFTVNYEMLYHEGQYLRPGRVLSAEFTNNGKRFEAFLFADPEGGDGYYAADGSNRSKGFLRSPLAFSRVSSGFGGRVHPIFRNWRAHTGVDFAAPRGTPVWSTSDGVVEYAGVKGGYGNVVEVRHAGSVTTLYAHLSSFASGIHKGARVSQGQTIAYVGATGYATGPHLHYEFKYAGKHQDPLRVVLPKAEPLHAKHLVAFKSAASKEASTLALYRDIPIGRFE